jgi:hypothetical protein
MIGYRSIGGLALGLALLATSPAAGRAQQPSALGPHGRVRAELDCSACHTASGWTPLKAKLDFDHDAVAGFELTGRHATAPCVRCHTDARFDEPRIDAADCGSCHVDVHQGQVPANCSLCHNTSSFSEVAGGSVHAATNFPLTGAHLQLSCESCHPTDRGGAFAGPDPDCYSCHADDYASGGSIDHVASGFSTDCQDCHSTLAWTFSVAFDHISVSGGFELLGAHARVRCTSCHIPPGMTPIYTPADEEDCIACHRDDYERQHGGSGFPEICTVCHDIFSWGGAVFDHAAVANGYELVGAHEGLDCTACHIVPGMALKFTPANEDDCVACHQADYDREHTGTGFPTTCLSCHDVNDWRDATFADHDRLYFPIYSGKHRGKWNDCQTCHTGGNFAAFSCLGCHEHRRERMDEVHRERPGYAYDSQLCLQCHPRGEGDD